MPIKQKKVTTSSKPKRRFTIWKNEGSWFDEPWLHDATNNKDYRHDRVPPKVKKAFAEELCLRGKGSPEEFRMIVDWVRYK